MHVTIFSRWALYRILSYCFLFIVSCTLLGNCSIRVCSGVASELCCVCLCCLLSLLCSALTHVLRVYVHVLCIKDLKDFMRQAGDITYADAHKTRVGEG